MATDDPNPKGPAGQRAATYPISRLSAPISLVDAAREIEKADELIASTVGAELGLLAEQIRALSARAHQVIERAKENAELHRVKASFRRLPGKIYHLYARDDGERYWSMLSPDDWNGAPPHTFVESYRLEGDQSWTPLSRIREADEARAMVEEALGRKLLSK